MQSNDILGEAFADQQTALANSLEASATPSEAIDLDFSAGKPLEMPRYAYPLLGGLCIILIFCFMIGILILEPGSQEKERRRRNA